MPVVRFVLLGILVYIAWRLLRGITRGSGKAVKSRRNKEADNGPGVQDVLVEDQVCGKLVPKSQAVRCRINGKTHYFCSDTCCDQFSEEQRKEA
jgi:YHS domain-containing protein